MADVALLFGASDDDTVDPDAAVPQSELLGHRLELLDDDERAALTAGLRDLASAPSDPGVRDLLAGLPASLGLVADE